AEIAAAVAGDDPNRLADCDVAFHDLLYQLADHDLLQRAWLENVAGKLRILLNVTTRTLPTLADAERQHRDLLEPILAKDKRLARSRIGAHIDEAWQRAQIGLEASLAAQQMHAAARVTASASTSAARSQILSSSISRAAQSRRTRL